VEGGERPQSWAIHHFRRRLPPRHFRFFGYTRTRAHGRGRCRNFGGDCRRDIFVSSGTPVPASAVAGDSVLSLPTGSAAQRCAE